MSVIVSFLLVLCVYYSNYMGTSSGISDLSQVFPFPYMPQWVFFMGAWTLIFALIGIFAVMMLVNYFTHKKINHKLMWLFAGTSVLNALRVYVTSQAWYLAGAVIIALLMVILAYMLHIYKSEKLQKSFGRRVFGAYYGWVSMATTVLTASMVVYLFYPAFALGETWTAVALSIGIIVTAVSFARRRNRAALALSLWAIVGALLGS